jgi:hypothetical protein
MIVVNLYLKKIWVPALYLGIYRQWVDFWKQIHIFAFKYQIRVTFCERHDFQAKNV